MFKGNRIYIVFLVICFALLVIVQVYMPKPIDWSLSYAKKEKTPFGTSALYKMLPDIFPNNTITDVTLPLYNSIKNKDYTNCNLIIINSVFRPDTLDIRELLTFAANGNNVFIAANYLGDNIADTLKINSTNYWSFNTTPNSDSTKGASLFNFRDTVMLNFVNPKLKQNKDYIYSKGVEATYLSSFDTVSSTVLGTNDNGKINFIRTRVGKGYVYINTFPEAFSNYYFVSTNYSYVSKALSYLPNQHTLWDEYYKATNVPSDSILRVVFEYPALQKAYYVLLLSLILFMIIGAKRKQRIIPVIEPYPNTTLQFVDVVGTLYYQTGNHKTIADKKITYFLDYIRSNFQTKTTMYDDAFIDRIANLSGVERASVHELFYYFSDISIKQSVTEQELLKLNTMIENFTTQSKR